MEARDRQPDSGPHERIGCGIERLLQQRAGTVDVVLGERDLRAEIQYRWCQHRVGNARHHLVHQPDHVARIVETRQLDETHRDEEERAHHFRGVRKRLRCLLCKCKRLFGVVLRQMANGHVVLAGGESVCIPGFRVGVARFLQQFQRCRPLPVALRQPSAREIIERLLAGVALRMCCCRALDGGNARGP
jgi:hypothetical protein